MWIETSMLRLSPCSFYLYSAWSRCGSSNGATPLDPDSDLISINWNLPPTCE
jgi:hypothetical protein